LCDNYLAQTMTGRVVRLKPLFYEATSSKSPEPWMAKAIHSS
jgi:hypothetical protein